MCQQVPSREDAEGERVAPDKRVVLIDGDTEPSVYPRFRLSARRESQPPSESEIKNLENLLALPKPTTSSLDGNKPSSKAPEPKGEVGDGQLELGLDFSVKDLVPVEVDATPALDSVIAAIQKIDPSIIVSCYTYNTSRHSNRTFLDVIADGERLAFFDDDGEFLSVSSESVLLDYGFTEKQLSNILSY